MPKVVKKALADETDQLVRKVIPDDCHIDKMILVRGDKRRAHEVEVLVESVAHA